MRRSLAVALVGVVAMAAGVAMAEEIVDFARDGHGWCAANHVTNVCQTATGYAFDVTDEDPWCVASATYAMPPQPAGAAYLCIELETAPVENPVSFQIYWHAEKPLFNERESAHLKPVGPSPCTTFVAELPAGLIGSEPVAIRIDPPGKSSTFASVEFRYLRASYVCAEWTPNFSAPPPSAFVGEPLALKGDGWSSGGYMHNPTWYDRAENMRTSPLLKNAPTVLMVWSRRSAAKSKIKRGQHIYPFIKAVSAGLRPCVLLRGGISHGDVRVSL